MSVRQFPVYMSELMMSLNLFNIPFTCHRDVGRF